MRIHYAAATHPGLLRENNEDNFYVQGRYRTDVNQKKMSFYGKAMANTFLAAVCDGMGGESSGEIASLLAVETLIPHGLSELPEAALEDICRANEKVCEFITENGGQRSGSTLAALYIDNNMILCCNVGDSRIYRFRDHQLTQLSKDHNRAQQMLDQGLLAPDQIKNFRDRNVLIQYLGIFPQEMTLDPCVVPASVLIPGDIYLICSDGLTDMLWDGEIAQILDSGSNVTRLTDALIQEALASGGRDNVTVVIVKVE